MKKDWIVAWKKRKKSSMSVWKETNQPWAYRLGLFNHTHPYGQACIFGYTNVNAINEYIN